MMSWEYSNYSKVNKEVIEFFPFKKPRNNQLETISEIIEAVDNGYKYIVLEAGTGTGKSAVATCLSRYYGNSYILTHTKQLQNQYYNDFKELGFKVVKGRSNFQCRKYPLGKSCDVGRCIVEGYFCEYAINNTCNYLKQKNLALNTDNIISNYHYLFFELNYINDFTNRNLIVFDEAHNLEAILMNQLSCEFSKKDLKKYLNYNLTDTSPDHWVDFIENIKVMYQEAIERENDFFNVYFMKTQINMCNNFLNNFKKDSASWICDWDNEYNILQFKPLKINNYAKSMFFDYADICLFMSATILDYKLFAKWLGISPDEVYPIRKKSPFDMQTNNPIKTYRDFNLSYSNIKVNAFKTIKIINDILNNHKNEKGFIHTVSSNCQDFLVSNLKNPRLITHNNENRISQFEKFKNSKKALVFISPSFGEGVDLPGELCSFQIMFKLPRPDWGDKQIFLRSKQDIQWYDYQTCLNLVQMHGRGMRFEDDYCMNYFIDNRLNSYVLADERSNNFLPESFKNSIDVFSKNLSTKKDLIKKGDKFLKNNDYEKAIDFYNNLCNDELFLNDYYPYLKLSKLYHKVELYEQEVQILVKFLKSGINCNKKTLNKIFKQLKKLDKMGYFDYSNLNNI